MPLALSNDRLGTMSRMSIRTRGPRARFRAVWVLGLAGLGAFAACQRNAPDWVCVSSGECERGVCRLGRCVELDAGEADRPDRRLPVPVDTTDAGNPASSDVGGSTGQAQIIGPEGGRLLFDLSEGEAWLDVPAGAVSAAASVNLSRSATPAPDSYVDATAIVCFESVGLTLSKPVTVSLPVRPEADTSSASIYWRIVGQQGFERLGTTLAGPRAEATTWSLGCGFAADGVRSRAPIDVACLGAKLLQGTHAPPAMVGLFFRVEDCEGRPRSRLRMDEIEIFEVRRPLMPSAPRMLAARNRMSALVTLVVDASLAQPSEAAALAEGARGFFETLDDGLTGEEMAVATELVAFDHDGRLVPLTRPMRPPSVSVDTALASLAPPAAERRDLHGAIIAALHRTDRWVSEYRDRNGGTAPVTSYVVVVAGGVGTQGQASSIEVAAARDQLPFTRLLLVLRDNGLSINEVVDLETAIGGAILLSPTAPSSHGSALRRELAAAGNAVADGLGATHLLTYCSTHRRTQALVGLRIAEAPESSAQRALYTFDPTGFGPGCTAERLTAQCVDLTCGGFACGGCDDALAICDSARGACVPHCDAMGLCGGVTHRTPLGYEAICPDAPERQQCDGRCVNLARDVQHCGACGRPCDGVCSSGECLCVDDRESTRTCGRQSRGTTTRICRAGRWGPWSKCDDPDVCFDGAERRESCGLNRRGLQRALCVDGRWRFEPCSDPDACEDGRIAALASPCGLNRRGRRFQTCLQGRWVAGACVDPDLCREGDRRLQGASCGLNGRGRQISQCLEGQWPAATLCADPDACTDGERGSEPLMCGINGRGAQPTVCRSGHWEPAGECQDPDACRDEATRMVPGACGRNQRGERPETCAEGRWIPSTACADPDLCVDGESGRDACGAAGRGVTATRCVEGRWRNEGECREPAACVEGMASVIPCGFDDGGAQRLECVNGSWANVGPCNHTHPERCADDRELQRSCGLNGRGAQRVRCVGGQWQAQEICRDDDACGDGPGERACGLNGRGRAPWRCRDGQWDAALGPCDDPDLCRDELTRNGVCGFNGRGTEPQTCVNGQWQSSGDCDDADVCRNGSSEERACGPNSRGIELYRCVGGAWRSATQVCRGGGVCVDEATQQGVCGRNQRGQAPQICRQGQWQAEAACVDPDVCTDDERRWRGCDASERGLQSLACVEGQWGAWSDCEVAVYVALQPGLFVMGSPDGADGEENERPQHNVILTRHFELKATEVTQGEWWGIMGALPDNASDCGLDCPVDSVSWWSVLDYANTLSERLGLDPCYALVGCDESDRALGTLNCASVNILDGDTLYDCRGYRLPTEAEWEYAARAGTTGARYGPVDDIAWHSGNAGGRARPVALLRPNRWGLYDMLGNVSEWTYDWSDAYSPEAVVNPTGPAEGTHRVNRGGSWIRGQSSSRAARRRGDRPAYGIFGCGFRLARSIR